MDITLKAKDGVYILEEADRQALMAAVLITPNYKDRGFTAKYDLDTFDSSAQTYSAESIIEKKAKLQEEISVRQAEIATLETIEAEVEPIKEEPVEVVEEAIVEETN